MNQLCFVCTANICRSPFAEFYARKRLQESGLNDFTSISTGVNASSGSPTTTEIIEIASEFEVDLTSHRSRRMLPELLSSSRMILVMEDFHLQEIIRQYPEFQSRTYLLRNFSFQGSRKRGIVDPFGLTGDFIRACFDDIAEAIDGLITHLQKS